MAKIYKVSGYYVDGYNKDGSGYYSRKEVNERLEEEFYMAGHHIHVSEAIIDDWSEEHPLNYNNPDLAECEKYFKAEPTIPSDRPLPQVGEQYKHFKTGKIVEVVGVSQDTENVGSYSVVYICKDQDNNGKLWHRPLDMFLSKVDAEKYPEHAEKWRFERVDE